MRYFTIRDTKAEAWNTPFPSATRGSAMRQLSLGLREDGQMREYASDFALYETAIFDQFTGTMTGYEQPIHVCDVTDLVADMETVPFNSTKETTPQLGVA